MKVAASSYRTSYVTSHIYTQSFTCSLLLQYRIAQSKLQIAHSKTNFQQKPKKANGGRRFYLKEQYNVTMGLYPIPKQQKTKEDPFLAKAYFLKDSQDISLIPDKYV
jgi:hypothetical protein